MKTKKKSNHQKPTSTSENSSNTNTTNNNNMILDEKVFNLARLNGSEMANDTNELVIVGKHKKDEKSELKHVAAPEKRKLNKKERKRLEKVLERKEKSQRVINPTKELNLLK